MYSDLSDRGTKKFGNLCESDKECGFTGSYCEPKSGKCICKEEFEATNHIDKCIHDKSMRGCGMRRFRRYSNPYRVNEMAPLLWHFFILQSYKIYYDRHNRLLLEKTRAKKNLEYNSKKLWLYLFRRIISESFSKAQTEDVTLTTSSLLCYCNVTNENSPIVFSSSAKIPTKRDDSRRRRYICNKQFICANDSISFHLFRLASITYTKYISW